MSEELAKQLEQLLEVARKHELSETEKEEERRSFAYGNAKIENPRINRAMIDQEAEALVDELAADHYSDNRREESRQYGRD